MPANYESELAGSGTARRRRPENLPLTKTASRRTSGTRLQASAALK